VKTLVKSGFTVLKTGIKGRQGCRIVETKQFIDQAVSFYAAMRETAGPKVDIPIDFHGAISPQTSLTLIKALEQFQPFFIEEPVQCQNVDVLADISRKTHVPIATGERIFTKWGFREVLEKRAASILQPDLSHAGGIFECRIIAGMAESYYAAIAPHCPLGPIALAASVHLDALIPNFLIQERVTFGEGYLKDPLVFKDGYIELPKGPGLGIELDMDAMEDKIGHEWKNREVYSQDDGSVTDW
jgi:galactonate dehydratase